MGATLIKAGAALVPFLDKHLFDKGYNGRVIISSAKFDTFDYLKAAVMAAKKSPNEQRYFFTFDQEDDDYIGVIDLISRLTNNRVYGTGASSCEPNTFYPGIKAGVVGQTVGENGMTYIWTLDKESSMRTYIDLGVQGIMTNRVSAARQVAISMGLTLAQVSDAIPVSMTSVSPQNECDCDYHSGGCAISRPPPPGKACKCSYKGAWTCTGTVVSCLNRASPSSTSPDLSPATCVLGGGDCEGYQINQSCDCTYIARTFLQPSGCKISKVISPDVACRCEYEGAWSCTDYPVACDISQPKCANPDDSKEACKLGGGDCDGY